MDQDAQLARAAAAGDAAAFSQLVRRHEAAVRRFLRRLAGHSADDLAQETFVQAWRLASSWKATGAYKSWLMGIAWSKFLGAQRQGRRRLERESQWEMHAAVSEVTTKIDVEHALATLPERERAAALLCFGEGCSHSEAAAIMQVPLGTLKSIAARARRALARQLEDSDD